MGDPPFVTENGFRIAEYQSRESVRPRLVFALAGVRDAMSNEIHRQHAAHRVGCTTGTYPERLVPADGDDAGI